jgi:hypothetical protein
LGEESWTRQRTKEGIFEIMTGTLIPTFSVEAPSHTESRGEALRHSFISEKKQLE